MSSLFLLLVAFDSRTVLRETFLDGTGELLNLQLRTAQESFAVLCQLGSPSKEGQCFFKRDVGLLQALDDGLKVLQRLFEVT
jgi:hypothetical protein